MGKNEEVRDERIVVAHLDVLNLLLRCWLSSFRDKKFNRAGDFLSKTLNLLVSFYSWAGSHR